MTNYVIINGVNSNTINGLGINELPPITKPQMRVQNEEIDGRDGDITTNLGYSAYDKTITIGLFGTGYDINDIVAFFNGEGTIVFSNEADKYYNFKIINQIDYVALQKFKSATITFHCQPFKYPLTETPLEIEYSYIEDEGENLTLNDTAESTLELNLKGNTSQTGTPTPSTPIDVNVVSGDNEVVVCGKNLLGLTDGTYSNNGITAEVSNGTITLNGTATGSTSFIEINLLQKATFNNESYTVSLNNPTVATDSSTEFRLYAIDNSYLSVYLDVINNKKTTTTNRTYTRVQIKTPVGVSYNDFIMKPQLEIGTDTPYELYQSQSYPINLPVENLFDTVNIVDGEYYNTSGNEVLNGDFFRMANYVNCYGISNITISGASTSYAQLIFYDENKNFLDYWGVRDRTIAVPNNAYYFRASALKSEKDTVMIEKGSKANHYTPYGTTPIELCKIGTYQDYFTKNSDGQWCKYNAIGKVVLDGSENWTYYRDIAGSNLFRMPFANYTKNVTCYSNNYKGIAGTSGRTNFNIYLLESANSSNLDILDNRFTSVSDFNIWLSTHNTQVDYVLASPYLSLIEDNNLIEQLDNLQNAMSYSGTTNINQVNDDKAFIISSKALEEGSNEVVVNNIGNAYSKPLIALEGSGNVDIFLENTQILKANVEDKMNIDIAKLEAYNPDTSVLLNRQVIGNYNSMTLQPGNNTIRIDGALDKATISNYTRWL